MALDKRQKKQIDVAKKKLATLRQQLAGSKKQMDDADEVRRLEREIKTQEEAIQKIQAE